MPLSTDTSARLRAERCCFLLRRSPRRQKTIEDRQEKDALRCEKCQKGKVKKQSRSKRNTRH